MATRYFDASALVKRYDQQELGAALVVELCRRDGGDILVLAELTSTEVASALGRKRLRGEIDRSELQSSWNQFVDHREAEYRFVQIIPPIYRRAEQIVLTHDLRASDAIQIACALHVRPIFGPDADFHFITADRRQAAAAEAEGLAVELVA